MSELEQLRPPFSRRAETNALAKKFISMATGESVLYEKVSDLIGIDPQSETGRGITASARALVQRENDIVIECVRDEGFRRASDPEKVQIAKGHIIKMRRTLNRGSKVVQAADIEKLNQDERIQYTLTVSWFGALNQATKPALAKEITHAIEQSSEIQCGDVLTLILSKSKNAKRQ